jgi:hypothetical protein
MHKVERDWLILQGFKWLLADAPRAINIDASQFPLSAVAFWRAMTDERRTIHSHARK